MCKINWTDQSKAVRTIAGIRIASLFVISQNIRESLNTQIPPGYATALPTQARSQQEYSQVQPNYQTKCSERNLTNLTGGYN